MRIYLKSQIISMFMLLSLGLAFGQDQSQDSHITIKFLQGMVSYKRPPSNSRQTLRIGIKLRENDIIYTENESRVEMEYKDGSSVTIEENSLAKLGEVQITGDTTINTLKMKTGKILFKIKDFAQTGSLYKFETPTVIAGIRGTEGGLGHWGNRSMAFLKEGRAELSTIGEQGPPTMLAQLQVAVHGPEGFEMVTAANLTEFAQLVDQSQTDLIEQDKEAKAQAQGPQGPDIPESASADTDSAEAESEKDGQPQSQPVVLAPAVQAGASPAEGAQPQEEAPKGEDKPGEGLGFTPGLTFGTMTKDGQTWTRFSFRPEITIWKLGVALDLELFMNAQNEFDSYGWDFSTSQNTWESVFRKIYYVRWAHPGDPLYLKLGSLDGITLGYGLIMSGYGNTALYPDRKLLGLHGQLNGLNIWDMNLEWVLNSFQEVMEGGGGVVAGRLSLAPLNNSGLPLLSKLRIGGTVVSDLDQLGGLPDRDGDNCPDGLDVDPNNKRRCASNVPRIEDDSITYDWDVSTRINVNKQISIDSAMSSVLKETVQEGDQFSLMSFDAGLPIITSKFLTFEVYSEIAFQMYRSSNSIFDGGYGLILPGAMARLFLLTARLEYRYLTQPFYPGHFNSMYESERAEIRNNGFFTKEEKYWSDTTGTLKGIFGSLNLDLKGLANVGGSYQILFPDEGKAFQGYSGRAALGQSIASLIPKLASAEVFWVKDKIGEDLNPDGDLGSKDSFFQPSIYTYYGYGIGIEMGGGLTITVKNINTYVRGTTGELTTQTSMSVETAITF